ncbi:MAG: CDP-glycerol glycerophosphotransferase family protein [Lactobacillales bacterium]|nr:CDP-glycerol glycerophosphotransferase family protein [Lactobacillales bacterium]
MKKVKKIIIDISKKNKLFRKFFKKLRILVDKCRYNKYKYTTKVDDKTILFEAYQGRNYACSPKEIYLQMLKDSRFKDYNFIWCFKDIDRNFEDKRTTLVKRGTKEYYKAYAKSKYWIVNSLVHESFVPKKKQVFVQCWHGTPLKKLRCDIEFDSLLNDVKDIRKRNDIDARRFDYFISPSKFCTEKFTSSFNLKKLKKENIMIEEGYPRNDFLFSYTEKDVKKLKQELNLPNDKKVILYAPTFRDNQHKSGVGYTYELGIDLDKLQDKISDEYIILFRTHYFVANSIDLEKYKGFIYDVSKYDDISRLYVISDLLITDYSSVFFDFANLKRPMLFYMYDLDEYKNQLRDFYIDIEELPGPIIDKEEDLINEIKNIKNYEKTYKDKYKKFNEKFNYLDDKNSSKRVIDKIFENL